jgi:SAM-dependent methyltransferase
MENQGNRAEVWVYVDLFFLSQAKLGRRNLDGSDDSEELYDEFFNQNDVEAMSSGSDLRRRCRAEVLTAAAWVRMPPGACVLDGGCGAGGNLRYILRKDAAFHGLEYAAPTAQIARAILKDAVDIRVGSATAIPFGDAEFDLILCIEVLEHVEQDHQSCAEIARVLKPEGALILSLPYRHWFPPYFSSMGHLRHYTCTDVEQLLAGAGMVITQRLPNYPRWSRFANYIYITCRIYAFMLRAVGVKWSPVEARMPGSRRPLMEVLFTLLDNMRDRERTQDFAALETSTFVVAQ